MSYEVVFKRSSDMDINKKDFFCSWSGGKDSCMALYYAIQQGGNPVLLFTIFEENGERSKSHWLIKDLIKAQSEALRLPIYTRQATWNTYEEEFIKGLKHIKNTNNIDYGVFGDIDIEDHRLWCEKVCQVASMTQIHPLWQKNRLEILNNFINAGFKAKIVVINTNMMSSKFIGRDIDLSLLEEIKTTGIDPCGENGEYHTIVYDGPLFKNPVELKLGDTSFRDEYFFLDVSINLLQHQ